MLLFFEGMLLGFGAAVPLGPINLLIMNEALRNYPRAFIIGFGAMSADTTYLLLILLGLTSYIESEMMMQVLSIIGGSFLIYLGVMIFRGRHQEIEEREHIHPSNLLVSYFKGYLLTLLNPYTIFFWLGVTSYSHSTEALHITLLGMMSAILLWITLMPLIIYRKRSLVSQSVATKISIVSSFIIGGFGVVLLLRIFAL